MNTIITVVLTLGSLLGLTWVARILLSISTVAWYDRREEEVRALKSYGCDDFHRIMSQPKPWYVRLNATLEARHI